MMMNKLASDVALSVQNNIIDQQQKLETTSVRIPIGTAFKSQLLAKYGPKITINITPIGMANVDFKTQFEEAGINQTRHRIYLIIETQVRVIVPFSASATKVKTTVPVAETIIVGRVPQSYLNVPEEEVTNFMSPE